MQTSRRFVLVSAMALVAAGAAASPTAYAGPGGGGGGGGGKPPGSTISVVQFASNGTALSAKEGQVAPVSIVVTRSNSTGVATFNLSPFDGSAVITDDYVPLWSNPVTIDAGKTSTTVLLGIANDLISEPTETMTVKLSTTDPVTQVGKKNTAVVTITDNDPCSPASVNDQSGTEGSSLTFTVSMAAPCGLPVQVHWATGGGTATAGSDYTAGSGNVAIAAGATSTTFNVATLQDAIDEPAETFNVTLSAPVNTTIGDGTGVGTINDDDAAPTLSIADNSSAEGDAGQSGKTFTVSVSGPSASNIHVTWSTSAVGTAKGWNVGDARNDCAHNSSDGTDFVSAAGGFLDFAASGSTPAPQNVTVQVCGDTTLEGNETFLVELDPPSYGSLADGVALGTIQNDDDDDGDGVSDVNDLCPGTTAGDPVDVNGCSASQVDTDSDGVPDITDNCDLTPNPGQEDVDGFGAGDACDDYTEIAGTSTGTENGNDGSFAGAIDNTSNFGAGHPDGTYAGQFTNASATSALAECGGGDGFFVDGTVTLTYGTLTATFDLDMLTSYFCVNVLGATPALTTYTAHLAGAMTSGTGPWTGATGAVTYVASTSAQDVGGIRTDTAGLWSGFVDLVP